MIRQKFIENALPEIEEDAVIDLAIVEDKEKLLILHNDDHNTFDWVIENLIKICAHSSEQAEQCAYITHYNGKCQVMHGTYNKMEKLQGSLSQQGLSVTIE